MEINIDKRTAEVQLIEKDGNNVRIAVDDRIYDVDIVIADNGICSLIHDGESFNMEVLRLDNGRKYKVNRGFNSYDVEIVDAQERYMRSRRKDDGLQDDTIIAPMPGKIVKINVSTGDHVSEGCTLIVFEAMKMQSNLNVVGDCKISEILISEGDSVASGQPLIKLDIVTNDEKNE